MGKKDAGTFTEKMSTTFRLSEECRTYIGELASWYGVPNTGVLEIAVRALYRLGAPVAAAEVAQDIAAAVIEAQGPPAKPATLPAPEVERVMAPESESASTPKKRGRPRKHPLPDPN